MPARSREVSGITAGDVRVAWQDNRNRGSREHRAWLQSTNQVGSFNPESFVST